nr:MAG TPA: hypothetical protein [Caudoviricetes sp.]
MFFSDILIFCASKHYITKSRGGGIFEVKITNMGFPHKTK